MPGVIDTIKLRFDCPVSPSDGVLLAEKFGFQYQSSVRTKGLEGAQSEMSMFFSNKDTGVRVLSDGASTFVEGSLPRALGLSNDEQEGLTEGDVVEAVDRLSWGILPETTAKSQPGITRMDLARNFHAPVSMVVERYSCLRHPEVRAAAKVFFGESVSYFGSHRECVIYDKGREMAKRPNELGRVESRWLGQRGIEKLLGALNPDFSWRRTQQPALPFWLKWGSGKRIAYVPFTHDSLNSVLCADVASIGRLKPVPVLKRMNDLLFFLLKDDSEGMVFYRDILRTMSRPARLRWENQRRTFLASTLDYQAVDLVNLIWGEAA